MLDDPLSLTFSALADPTRRAILARLALGETSVNKLAQPFAISKPGISKHLKVLEKAGLIARGRDAQFRPCRLESEKLKQVDEWLGVYRKLWIGHMDRLEAYVTKLQEQEESQMNIHSTTNRQITLTRLIAAPRELVFKVFTEADHHANWHCPEGFTITPQSADIREGGSLYYIMHGPDGTNYANRHHYHEIKPFSRITYTHGGEEGDTEQDFEVTITFEDRDGKTLVTNNLLLKTVEQYNLTIGFGAVELGNTTMAKLETYALNLAAKG